MKRAYHIAAAVALNMRAGLARVEMAENFRPLSDHFADGPITLAQTAFLYGRAYGHREAAKIDSIELPDREQHAAEVRADPLLKQQLEELRECGREVTRRMADTLHHAVGEADTVDLLSQWKGFTRFCHEKLGADPLTTSSAFLSGRKDVAAALAASFPNARHDEAQAAPWPAEWAREWGPVVHRMKQPPPDRRPPGQRTVLHILFQTPIRYASSSIARGC